METKRLLSINSVREVICSITQDDPLRNKVFRTSWSILENAVYDGASGMYTEGYIADNILALHPTARTVENDPEILNNTVTD